MGSFLIRIGIGCALLAGPPVLTAAGVAPVAQSMELTLASSQPCSLTLMVGDGETQASELVCEIVSPPAHGILEFRTPSSRLLRYTSHAGFTGADAFTFRCSDGSLTSAVATCTLSVTSNGVPSVSNTTASAAVGIPVEISLKASQPFGDKSALAVSLVEAPAHGTLGFRYPESYPTNSATVVYTPTQLVAADAFTFRAANPAWTSGVATCAISLTSNVAPTAAALSTRAASGQSKPLTLAVSDTFPASGRLACSIVQAAQHGTVTWRYPQMYPTNSRYVVYTSAPGFTGTDRFAYVASDGVLTSGTATCTVTVATNTAPRAQDGQWTASAGTPLALTLGVTDNDTAAADLVCTIESAPTNGLLAYRYPTSFPTSSRDLVYTPNPGGAGADLFTYRVADGELTSGVATGRLTILANAAPIAYSDSIPTVGGMPVDINLVAEDETLEPENLVYRVATPAAHGRVEYRSTTSFPQATYLLRYTPDPGFAGTDTFTFVANDWALDSIAATCTVTVTSNSAPTAADMAVATVESTAKAVDLAVQDDFYSEWDLECVIVSNPVHGIVSYRNPALYPSRSCQLTYLPQAGFAGTDRFSFRCSDGTSWSGTATCTVQVAANIAPRACSQWVHALPGITNQPLRVEFLDPDGPALRFTVEAPPGRGQLLTNSFATDGAFGYAPAPGFAGSDEFSWRLSDGLATSALARCRILVHAPAARAGQTVLVMAETNLLPNVSNEVARLADDLAAEGFTARVVPWQGGGVTTPSNLWEYLRAEYQRADQFLSGAILIGDLPKPQLFGTDGGWHYTDLVYWNLAYYQTLPTNPAPRSIWVSRLIWPGSYGTEVAMLRRALQANHDYRRGASRLPHTAYMYMNAEWWGPFADSNNVQRLLEVWPQAEGRAPNGSALEFLPERVDISVGGADCLARGGDFWEETSHGSADGFMGMSAWLGKTELHRLLAQVRFICVGSCSSGAYGGIANHLLFTRAGGCVLAVGGSDANWVGDFIISSSTGADPGFRQRLHAGECFGNAAVQSVVVGSQYAATQTFALGSQYNDRTLFYGDLSLPAMAAPSNALPRIAALSASPVPTQAPFTVDFAVQADDPDGTISNIEWFCTGFDSGLAVPTASGPATNATMLYTQAGDYTVRVEVMDNHLARTWRELTITVPVDPAADGDGDGMADNWEIVHFGGTNAVGADPLSDADNDGFRDRFEYLAGTEPHDDTSLLRLTRVSSPGGGGAGAPLVLNWSSVTGRTYSLLVSTGLLDGSWAALETNLPATPPENELTLPTAGPKSLFKIGLDL